MKRKNSFTTKSIYLIALLLAAMLALLVGCGKEQAGSTAQTKVLTYENQQYTVPAQPKRIAVLSNSLLQMLYAVGGTSVGRPDTPDKLPPAMQSLPTFGHTGTINMETLLSLKPDLVLGLQEQHGKLADQLKSNNLPYLLISYDGIDDNVPLLTFLGQLTGHEKEAQSVISQYENNIKQVKDTLTSVTPARVAVLRATGKAVTAETDRAITASMVRELGMTNVVSAHLKDDNKSKTVPYSLETLATDDPSVIFIVTMGNKDEIAKTMAKEMTDNPAWSQLQAVKNGKVFYLPSNLFLLNPGLRTPEAMAELIKDAYGITVTLQQ